jgi:hypothetical protein
MQRSLSLKNFHQEQAMLLSPYHQWAVLDEVKECEGAVTGAAKKMRLASNFSVLMLATDKLDDSRAAKALTAAFFIINYTVACCKKTHCKASSTVGHRPTHLPTHNPPPTHTYKYFAGFDISYDEATILGTVSLSPTPLSPSFCQYQRMYGS